MRNEVREMAYPRNYPLWIRLGLGALALEGLVIGLHALFVPKYFYDEFFLGASWLTKLGAYSEHLTRDAGALYLALTIPTIWALVKLTPDLVQAVAIGNAFAAFPHMIFHLAHRHESGNLETVPQAGTLLLTVLLGLFVYWASRRQAAVAAGTAGPAVRPAATRQAQTADRGDGR